MTFLDLTAELVGVLPGLSPFLAEKHLNRAYAEILGARNWSFLVTDGVVVCPTQITTGAAAIVQYTDTITLNAAGSAAIAGQIAGGAVPGILNLQIRLNPTNLSPATSQVYSITDFDATVPAAVVLTLDRVVVESTDAASGIQIYRAYITPPLSDFRSWLSLVDMVNGWDLRRNYSSQYFDRRDPQRQAQGQAYFIGSFQSNRIGDPVTGATTPNATVNQGTPLYELWPHPTAGQTFYVRFRRKGDPLTLPTDEPLEGVPDDLIIQRALGWNTYPWAMANVGHYPQFAKTNFVQLINSSRSSYKEELLQAKRNDDEKQLQTVFSEGYRLRQLGGGWKGLNDFPIDANFMQSHLVRF